MEAAKKGQVLSERIVRGSDYLIPDIHLGVQVECVHIVCRQVA